MEKIREIVEGIMRLNDDEFEHLLVLMRENSPSVSEEEYKLIKEEMYRTFR